MSEPNTNTRLADLSLSRNDLRIVKTLLVLVIIAAVSYGVYYVVDQQNEREAQSIQQNERFGLEYQPPR